MAAIPIYEQRTSAQSAGLGPGPQQPTGSPLGEGLQTVAGGLQDYQRSLDIVKERDAAAWSTQALAQTQSDWLQNLDQRKLNAEPGAPDFTPQLLKDFDEHSQNTLTDAPTPTAKKFMQARLTAFRGELARDALGFEASARSANNENIAKKSVDDAGNELISKPQMFAVRLAERRALIEAMNVSPMDRQKLNDYAQAELAKYSVIGRINSNPYATMQALMEAQPKDLAIASLNPKERLALIEHADSVLRSQIADASRLDAISERNQKKAADVMSKNGDLLLSQGKLTAQWIEDHRGSIDPADYRYFYRALSGEGDAPRDPMIYADLRSRSGSGEDVRDDARSALQRGAIRIGDYNTILNEVEQERPGWYKRGSQFISTSAAVSDLNPDPAAAQRKARMLDDWNAWATANPKATDQQAQAEYQRVVQEYAIVDQQNFTITKRAPRYLVGSRNQPDIDATERQTVKAFKDGQIDQAEFERQAALLKEWRQALAHQVKPKQATQ